MATGRWDVLVQFTWAKGKKEQMTGVNLKVAVYTGYLFLEPFVIDQNGNGAILVAALARKNTPNQKTNWQPN